MAKIITTVMVVGAGRRCKLGPVVKEPMILRPCKLRITTIHTTMVLKTRLAALPDIEDLRRLTQSLAMLDAIKSPEWEYRYYSFNSKWDEGEMMASMRNGSGDEYFILFDSHGAIMKGFDHESSMSPWSTEEEKLWLGIFDDVPPEFQSFLSEPAFSIPETTFCIWRRYIDPSWQVGRINYPDEDDPDGSEYMLSILDGQPSTYKEFAESYYEKSLDLEAIEQIYRHEPLTNKIVARLNDGIALESLITDVEQIAYPKLIDRGMRFRTIKLPNSERFACSARKLKAAFSDVENLEVYCGVLGKSFAFDSRSKKRPRFQGMVVAQAQVSRDLASFLILYVLSREDYPKIAADEFCDSIIPEIHEWLNCQLAKPKPAILGVESLLIEWTGREHIKHVMRFL